MSAKGSEFRQFKLASGIANVPEGARTAVRWARLDSWDALPQGRDKGICARNLHSQICLLITPNSKCRRTHRERWATKPEPWILEVWGRERVTNLLLHVNEFNPYLCGDGKAVERLNYG